MTETNNVPEPAASVPERTILIRDIKAVRELSIRLQPGVTVLEGRNGSGKSSAIEAVSTLIAGEGGLEARRGALSGHISGFGAEIKVGKRTGRTGELQVLSLQGDGDPSLFINPGPKGHAAADAIRIGEACKLAGLRADSGLFARLLPGGASELRATAKPETLLCTTLSDMARRMELDFQNAARDYEARAENERGRALGLRQGVDITEGEPSDEALLRAASDEALRLLHSAQGERQAARSRAEAIEQARQKLDEAARTSGSSVEDAERRVAAAESAKAESVAAAAGALQAARDALTAAGAARAERQAEVREAEAALQRARSALGDAFLHEEKAAAAGSRASEAAARAEHEGEAAIREARSAVERARRAQDQLADLRAQVERGAGDAGPSDEMLAALRSAADAASIAKDRGAVVRDGLRKLQESDEAAAMAEGLRRDGERLRAAARACWDVLGEALSRVCPVGMSVQDGLLRYRKPSGEEEWVHNLSDGERGRLGVLLGELAGGPGCVIPMDKVWQELDPDARDEVAQEAEARGCFVLVAQAARGEIRAVHYAPEAQA